MAIRMQRAAIIAHCSDMTRRLGRRVSLDEAARDWIPIHAELWRANLERQTAARSFGIELSDAPILLFRPVAYSVSVDRRV